MTGWWCWAWYVQTSSNLLEIGISDAWQFFTSCVVVGCFVCESQSLALTSQHQLWLTAARGASLGLGKHSITLTRLVVFAQAILTTQILFAPAATCGFAPVPSSLPYQKAQDHVLMPRRISYCVYASSESKCHYSMQACSSSLGSLLLPGRRLWRLSPRSRRVRCD